MHFLRAFSIAVAAIAMENAEATRRNRTALMLVDIQYDFLPPNGALAVTNGTDILPTVYDLLDHKQFDAYFASQASIR
jgi:hypothetical protein